MRSVCPVATFDIAQKYRRRACLGKKYSPGVRLAAPPAESAAPRPIHHRSGARCSSTLKSVVRAPESRPPPSVSAFLSGHLKPVIPLRSP